MQETAKRMPAPRAIAAAAAAAAIALCAIVAPAGEAHAAVRAAEPALPIAAAKVRIADAGDYTGLPKRPAVAVTVGGKALRAGRDYTVAYSRNTDAGTARVTIKGTGAYRGTRAAAFRIGRAALSSASVKGGRAAYSGRPVRPAVTVKAAGRTLRAGRDYTVAYRSNSRPGSALAVATGRGSYRGRATAAFEAVCAHARRVQSAVRQSPPYTGAARWLPAAMRRSPCTVFAAAVGAEGRPAGGWHAGYWKDKAALRALAARSVPAGGQVVVAERSATQARAGAAPRISPGAAQAVRCRDCGRTLASGIWWLG